MKQLCLDFQVNPAYTLQDFYPSEESVQILKMFEDFSAWESHCLIIYGDAGCGKTHLCHIFRAMAEDKSKNNALIAEATDLTIEKVPEMLKSARYIAVDNVHNLKNEQALFHLFNFTKENQARLLLTAVTKPSAWGLKLPDLISRLNTAVTMQIPNPTDEMMAAVLVKMFADRQIFISEEALDYLLTRTERSFDALRTVVQKADALSLSEKKGVTIPLLKKALGL